MTMTKMRFACLLLAAASTAALDMNYEFADLPGFRYSTWQILPTEMQTLATTAGYTEATWDAIGTAEIEYSRWAKLGGLQKNALLGLGFSDRSWDCYMNHYLDYDWNELIALNLEQAAEMRGYTMDLWDNDQSVATDDFTWSELDESQKYAAGAFCYFPDTWNEQTVNEFGIIPLAYPYLRYVEWSDLPAVQQNLARTAGWEEDTWNQPESADIEFQAFYELEDVQRQALMNMGFYEEQYDCYINHYQGWTWQDLVGWDLAWAFEAFGWNEDLYNNENAPVAWTSSGWDDLTYDQKEAADALCWFRELWEEAPVAQFGDDYVFPDFRFTQWENLSRHQQYLAAEIGWTKATWDTPGTAYDLEGSVFDDLSSDTQDNLRALGFISKNMYDCYINHYEDLSWASLDEYDLSGAMSVFGWTQASWDANESPPAAYEKPWRDLSENEKEAADALCWFKETWERAPLTTWKGGAAWPSNRYWIWDSLDAEEQNYMISVGYTADTWNTPFSSDLEVLSWYNLRVAQRETLAYYGFYEAQWNCYVTHFINFAWFELELAGVTEFFLTLGWSQEMWENDGEPDSWSRSWAELNEAEQEAATQVCYFRETWDSIPLPEWSEDVRSGASAAADPDFPDRNNPSPPRTGDDDGGSSAGIWIAILLVFGIVGGAWYIYKKKRAQKFQAAEPKGEPNLNMNTFDSELDLEDVPTIT